MNSKIISTKTRSLVIKNLMILSWLCSSFAVWAQDHHHHHHEKLTEKVQEVVKLTEKPLVVSPEFCPAPGDRAYVNFEAGQLRDPEGFHGMLFFGRGETFYISHLPMFHEPHNYQAIVEVRLKPEAKARYQAELARNGGYFTFAPEGNFVLPDVVTQLKPIKGALVQGHFERGGKELLGTELELVRVVFYKKISAQDKKPPKEKYIIFGKDGDYYMAHEIFERPNTDEIIPLPKNYPLSDALKSDLSQNGVAWVDDLEIKDQKVKVKKDQDQIEFPYEEFYRETGDLK